MLGAPPESSSSRNGGVAVSVANLSRPGPEAFQSRQSHGLEQFFGAIADLQGFPVLDLAGASQLNITFITNAGFRLYSDDFVRSLENAFGTGEEFLANQSDPDRVARFMSMALDFPANHFCGALLWDTLQFLAQPLLQDTVDQLYEILAPGAYMFAMFHADERASAAPVYSYRIADSKNILIAARGDRRPAQFFNNRNIEKVFQRFHSVKFFLTRDSLREIIVRR